MTATIIDFIPRSTTAQERNRARLDSITRKRDSYKYRIPPYPVADSADELLMDHADPGDFAPSEYIAPVSDPA